MSRSSNPTTTASSGEATTTSYTSAGGGGGGSSSSDTAASASAAARIPLSDYLSRHNLAGLFDQMLGECTNRVIGVAANTSSSSSSTDGAGNIICDAMSTVVATALYARSAINSKQCMPVDALNPNPANITIGLCRHYFSGKRIVVIAELPIHIAHSMQGASAEEQGPSLLSTLRLEFICKSIATILQLSGGGGGGRNPPKVVLAFVATDLSQRGLEMEEEHDHHHHHHHHHHKSQQQQQQRKRNSDEDDDDDDGMLESFGDMGEDDMYGDQGDDDDDTAAGGGSGGGGGSRLVSSSSRDEDLSPYDSAAAGGGGDIRTTFPLPDSAVYMLSAMLQGEGVEVEFLGNHEALLQHPSFNSGTAMADGGEGGGDNSNNNATPSYAPPRVSILPSVWISSHRSNNPLSVYDPVLAFADCVVMEGLESFRLKHPLLTHVPRAIGSAFLGIGAALELDAMRSLFTGGSAIHRKSEFTGSPMSGGLANAAAMASSAAAAKDLRTSRLFIIGDDEQQGEMLVQTSQPTTFLSTVVALTKSFESMVYLFDYMFLVGTAAMVLHHVQRRRRIAEAEAAAEGRGGEAVTVDWANPVERALSGLLDAVQKYSASVPGGCQVLSAVDFTFVKKTTSGKSKVDVIHLSSWTTVEMFSLQRKAPSKFYYVDVGPASRQLLRTTIEKCSYVVGFGSLTRCAHHVEGTRASKASYSAPIDPKDEADIFISAAASVVQQCRLQRTNLVVFGEHWLQVVSTELGVTQPLAPYVFHNSSNNVVLPAAVVSSNNHATPSSGLTGNTHQQQHLTVTNSSPMNESMRSSNNNTHSNTMQRTVSDANSQRKRHSSRSPDADRSMTPPVAAHPRTPCCRLLSQRFRRDQPVQDEGIHMSTMPYREAARIIIDGGGGVMEALQGIPCPVVPKSAR